MGEIHIYHLEVSMMISFEVKQGPKKVIDRYCQECYVVLLQKILDFGNLEIVEFLDFVKFFMLTNFNFHI